MREVPHQHERRGRQFELGRDDGGIVLRGKPRRRADPLRGREARAQDLRRLARLTAALVGDAATEGIHFAPATAVALRRRDDGWTLDLLVAPGG